MEHYVTLFDSLYLPQAMALHASMQRHGGEHRLWMLCMDEPSYDVLQELELPNVSLMRITDFETAELLEVKPGRTKGEYCWTLTPFSPRFVFESDANIERVTYVDADVWLRASPDGILQEFEDSGAGAMITEHSYAPEYDQSELSGRFCVQFMTFHRELGEPVRKWWEERCVEWCFNRIEDGKLGDQMYLHDWPERFGSQVHVMLSPERLLAPWNATRYPYSSAVAYHFHGLKLLPNRRVDPGAMYRLPDPVLRHIYDPYVVDLRDGIERLAAAGFEARPQAPRSGMLTFLRRTLGEMLRLQLGMHRWNVFKL